MTPIKQIHAWYEEHERLTSFIFIIGGFLFDLLTLQRIDSRWDLGWLFLHLTIVSTAIFLLNREESKNEETERSEKRQFWLLKAQQFSFGGLFGVLLIHYFRSATIAVSWPFIVLLVIAFVANESLKNKHNWLQFQISLLYLSVFSFLSFLLPVIFKRIGSDMFLYAGLASLIFIGIYLGFLRKFGGKTLEKYKKEVLIYIGIIFIGFNILYFTNIIPPLPISMKDAGVYYSVTKDTSGSYVVQGVEKNIYDRLKIYQDIKMIPGQEIYVYTAIFSPTKLNLQISHQWQKFDEENKSWVIQNTIPLEVAGGRDGGFRTFTTKTAYSEGKWRVNVMTQRGSVIGRVHFKISYADSLPKLTTTVKD